uniref:Uncharacterized protein n=1 Tax=Alexandrium monilatum TaxID=311494 RepID=A0A7S4UW82_9DINO
MGSRSEFHIQHNSTGALSPREAARLASQAAARYYHRVHQFRFEPLRSFDQFLVLCAALGVCFVLVYYWRQVLKCVVGDDKISIDRFQLIYWGILQCCGCCDGEWTRTVSGPCCCCFPAWRGRNLKRLFGESLGLYPISVRVQNIVVGSLPQDRYSWFPEAPSLFVQVVPDESSPTLNTEVVTEANTECTQFTSTLTLLVKNNPGDDPVRFIAKKMHLTGTSEVADCSVNPARLVMWAQQGRKVRLQMGGRARRSDPLSMPWILLDLSIPPEFKYFRKQVGVFTPILSQSALRGSTREGGEQGDPTPSLFCGAGDRHGFVDLPMTTSTEFFAITDAVQFQDSYPLVNDKGAEVYEDWDMAGQALQNTRSCANVIGCWVLALFLFFLLLRIFTSGCLEKYKQLEAIQLFSAKRGVKFEPHNEDLREAVDEVCSFRDLSLEIFEHIIHRDPQAKECFPPVEYAKCVRLQNTTRPWMLAIPCPPRTCSFDTFLEDTDATIWVVLFACICGICLCKLWEAHSLHREILTPPKQRRSGRSMSIALRGLDTR